MKTLKGKVAIVTGASSGFGEAIAESLAEEGVRLAIGARRVDRLQKLAKDLKRRGAADVYASELDVRDTKQVKRFVVGVRKALGAPEILINNAGLALGRGPLWEADEGDWEQMMETNFLGIYRISREVIPAMIKAGTGHIVNIGSIAGHFAYEGGGGYCGSKFAVTALTRALRIELVGSGVRVTAIDPGMAETEFSVVRFKGNRELAKKVYEGMTPLSAEDVAECVLFALTRPQHVNVDDILVTATDQGGTGKVFRRSSHG